MPGFVSIVGAGPWNPELITLAGLRRLQRAEVVIADYLANPNLLFHAPANAELIQRERGPAGGPRLRQPDLNDLMLERAAAGHYVVRLKGGDPCMFGRGGEEAQVLRAAGIDYEFVPGVSSPIAAPEAAGIPVTHRDHTPAVTFVSGYEAYEKAGLHVEWEHLARSAGTIVLMMSVKNARTNAQRLIEAGRAPTTPAAVIRWGTRGIQRTVTGDLRTIADRIDEAEIRAPSILVVGEVVDLRAQLQWIEARPLFGRRVVVTRPLDQTEGLVRRLLDYGADPLTFPCLRVDGPKDPAKLDASVAELHAVDGIILSSATGARTFFASLLRTGSDARALAGKRVVAIGAATAEACRACGIQPDLQPDEARSEGLVDALAQREWLRRVWLHVRAEIGRPQLGRAIEAAGGEYRLVAGYDVARPSVPETVIRSLCPPDAGGEGFDAILFASGKTVEHFLESVAEVLGGSAARELLSQAKVVSIGPVTTSALAALDIPVAATATEASDEGLMDALFASLGLTQPTPKPAYVAG